MMEHLMLIGAVIASPLFFLIAKYLTNLLFSYKSTQVKVTLTSPSGKKYSRDVVVSDTSKIIAQLDEVIAKAKTSKGGQPSE